MSFSAKVQQYRQNRIRSKPLPTGSAPFTSSLIFKQKPETKKPAALRWDHVLSRSSSYLAASPLKTASRGQPLISLGTARPTPEYYPWKKMMLECLDTAVVPAKEPPELSSMVCTSGEAAYDLAVAMNYGYSAGSPQALRFVTEHVEMDWDVGLGQGPKPRVLYMIPTGQNPTGTTQSLARRRETYRIAVKHDLFILEDDPYYFLQMGSRQPSTEKQEDANTYLTSLPPSYLSLDTDGRVLRMDTASKILAPGLRCGWITGCSQIIDKFIAFSEVGVSSPSGPSQVMLFKLLDGTWGHEGFVDWLHSLSGEYRRRRNILLRACNDHLPAEICLWAAPDAGMLVWIKVSVHEYSSHGPKLSPSQELCGAMEDEIYTKAQVNGVLVSKGSWFTEEKSSDEVFFRLTFAAAPEVDLARAVEGFADAVRSEFDCER